MPEMHLRQPGFTYSAFGIFTKSKERIKKLKETVDLPYIYQNELDKACFQQDMADGDFEDLKRWTAAYKALHDKSFSTGKNPNYDDVEWLQWFINFLIKRTSGSGIKNEKISNKELPEELNKKISNYLKI